MTRPPIFHTPRAFFTLLAAIVLLPTAAHADPLVATKTTTGTLVAGTRYATPYYIRECGQPGPIVMITGGVHGDEPAGAAAAEEIRHWRIGRGRIIVVPRLNVLGLAAHRRTIPGVEAALADLNRNFAHVARNEAPRGTPATEIWSFVQQQKPQWFIDLHEAHSLHDSRDGSVGNLLLCCPSPDVTKAQAVLLAGVNATIPDAGRQFAVGRPPKDSTLARAAGVHLGINSFIIETTSADDPLAVRVEHHCQIVRALLKYLGMEPGSKDDK